MANILVNAVGDQCPIPVVKANKALKEMKEPGILEVHVDNEIAVQNLSKLAGSQNLPCASEKKNDHLYVVTMTVADPSGEGAAKEDVSVCGCAAPEAAGPLVVAIDSECMGSGSEELGKTLMKGFIYAVSQLEELPKTIVFYNGGAKIPVEGSVSLEDLKVMEEAGVEIITCGTCLNFYELTDKLAVGSVTNMYNIVETLAKAGKVIKP